MASFLFSKKSKVAMRWIWIVFSVMIILSMTLVFSGGHQGGFGGGGHTPPPGGAIPPVENQLPDAGSIVIPANSEPVVEAPQDGEPTPIPITIPASQNGETEVPIEFKIDGL